VEHRKETGPLLDSSLHVAGQTLTRGTSVLRRTVAHMRLSRGVARTLGELCGISPASQAVETVAPPRSPISQPPRRRGSMKEGWSHCLGGRFLGGVSGWEKGITAEEAQLPVALPELSTQSG
jgi:hypothetical protein